MKEESYHSAMTQPISLEFAKPNRRLLLTDLEQSVCSAYNEARQFITSLDKSILKCKKYNEDRSYKKYQTYIKDLEKANKELKVTISILEQTISPTKQYMMDLLDKIVQAKQDKDSLAKQVIDLKEDIRLKQIDLEQYKMDVTKYQRIIKSNKVDKLPPIEENLSQLEDTLKAYLKEKEKIRTKVSLPASLLEEFISQNRKKLWGWNLFSFLEELQKYMEQVQKPKETEDLWRAQFRASKQFNKLIKSTKHSRTASTKHSLLSMNKFSNKKSLVNTSAVSEL